MTPLLFIARHEDIPLHSFFGMLPWNLASQVLQTFKHPFICTVSSTLKKKKKGFASVKWSTNQGKTDVTDLLSTRIKSVKWITAKMAAHGHKSVSMVHETWYMKAPGPNPIYDVQQVTCLSYVELS